MYLKNIVHTFLSKSIILVMNFLLVILTTHLWGAEGRGIISITMADLAIVVIFNNIMGGSSLSYMVPKTELPALLLPAVLWITVISAAGAFIFTLLHTHTGSSGLFALILVTSLAASNFMILIGKEQIGWYNLFSTILPLLHVLLLIIVFYAFGFRTVNSYFIAYFGSQLITWLLSWIIVSRFMHRKAVFPNLHVIKQSFGYGWKNELSYLLQFMNYRLSYFFILYYDGMKSVGLFSVGVALSESIWLISRSICTNQYAKIINHQDNAIELTKNSVKLSLYASTFLILFLAILPGKIYGIIFGTQFTSVKHILLYLIPGILAIAVTNIYGHYFSAIGQQRVLIIKSVAGLIATVGLSIILIPGWGITGACVVVSISYTISSAYLMVHFYRKIPFRFADFIVYRNDLKSLT